jgi:hypothetical protein
MNAKMLLVAWVVATLGSGCVMTGVQRYKESLVLTVLEVGPELTPDQAVSARLRLDNRGLSPLAFCIDDVSGALAAHNAHCYPRAVGVYASHPGCEHRVVLDPGDHYDWQKMFMALECPEPMLCVTAMVVLANPGNCQYGSCESIEMESTEPLCTHVPSKRNGTPTPGGRPSNNPIKLTVRPVTPLAQNASVAPVRPAAYRVRSTDTSNRRES